MTTIKVADFIDSGFSAEDADKLAPSINEASSSGSKFIVDFSGVQYFTTLFFSTALTRLIGELGEKEYLHRLQVINLSESGEETYKHALEYAIQYFEKTAAEREANAVDVNAVLEDM